MQTGAGTMNPLLIATIIRVIIHLCIALTGLILMVLFVQHNPNPQDGMKYIWLYCVPVLAAFTVLVSAMAIKDYLHPEPDEQEQEQEQE